MKIVTIIGARPQFIKIAPVSRAIAEHNRHTPHSLPLIMSEKGRIMACPQGHAPVGIRTGKKQKHSVAFSLEHCNVCPHKDQCPVKAGKKNRYFHYDLKTTRIANRRAMEYSPEFKDKYRWRSSIETIFSEMDKKTGSKRLRVRGLPALAYYARLKAIAVNLFRATAVRKALGFPGEALAAAKSGIWNTIFVFKEEFLKHMAQLANNLTPAPDELIYELKTAA